MDDPREQKNLGLCSFFLASLSSKYGVGVGDKDGSLTRRTNKTPQKWAPWKIIQNPTEA